MSLTKNTWAKVRELESGVKITLGPNTADRYLTDPKRLIFFLSRYKFAAKMLKDCASIVDIGCGDGFGTLTFIADTKATVRGIDFDADLIGHANRLRGELARLYPERGARLSFHTHDLLESPIADRAEGLSCMDVLEHIESSRADDFLRALTGSLTDEATAIIGTPNLHAKQYASAHSEIGHINDYDPDRLHSSLRRHFRHVHLFSMNDEVVHTGFDKLAHYLIALCEK
jgi:2-polyprenyl-3-methyl-5-hydroxy-6-metoxy-1,4-benzoquinol methylase